MVVDQHSILTCIRSNDMATDLEEIEKLRSRLDQHIEEHRIDELDYAERQLRQDIAHENNMKAIAALTESTQEVVNAWKVANGFAKFVKWLSSFALVAGFLVWIASKLPPDFFKV